MIPGFKPKRPSREKAAEVLKDRYQELEQATISHAQKYLIRRWGNFKEAGRPALIWLLIVIVGIAGIVWQTNSLSSYYLANIPASGGNYSEGVVGKVENFNPLFVSSEAENTVAELLFSGLLKYDARNNLTGDLASTWSVDQTGTVYTVTLRPEIRWHDGAKITSEDVVFTVATIQQESTRSPLAASWKGVKVEAVDPQTVKFTLPASFPPFPYSLTLRIIPKHILAEVPPVQLRTTAFNISPSVGSGPFKFLDKRDIMNRHIVRLQRNSDYFAGKIQPDRFTVYAFETYDEMISAFKEHEISAAGGLRSEDLKTVENEQGVRRVNAPLQHATFAFFKMSNPILQDHKVRLALSLATDKKELSQKLDGWFKPLSLPLLPGQLGYSEALDKSIFDPASAAAYLDQAGWVKDADGIRKKEGKPLELNLVASSSDEFPRVAAELQRQWQSLGVIIKTALVKPSDFQQNVIIPHSYDILLYELAIGQDPDVYAYWHSSQAAERGLNLSEYKSTTVDLALESGRSRSDPALRAAKYQSFLTQWAADVPAVALYQPGYGYAYRSSSVNGFVVRTLVDPVGRFYNITDWTAETRKAFKTH